MNALKEPEDSAGYYSRVLEAAVKAGTVAAVALPAMGVVSRWVSFFVGGVPSHLAVADNLPALALRGFGAIWMTLLWVPLTLLFIDPSRLAASSTDASSRQAPPSAGLVGRTIDRARRWWSNPRHYLLTVGLMFAVIALLSPFYILPVVAGFALGGSIGYWAARRDHVAFRTLIPVLVAVLAILTVSNGFFPGVSTPIYVRPVTSAELPRAGWYNVVGREDSWIYAWECSRGQVVAIPAAAIAGGAFEVGDGHREHPAAPGVLEVLSGNFHVGFHANCP